MQNAVIFQMLGNNESALHSQIFTLTQIHTDLFRSVLKRETLQFVTPMKAR